MQALVDRGVPRIPDVELQVVVSRLTCLRENSITYMYLPRGQTLTLFTVTSIFAMVYLQVQLRNY